MRLGTLLLAAALALSATRSATAEVAEPDELDTLQREIDTSREKQKELEAQVEAARKDAEDIRGKLIDTAARVQAREADVSASEDRLQGLKGAEAVTLAQLEQRREAMIELLAALTRLDRNPPPALAVKPDDALDAVRSAMLLGTAVPELQAEAAELRERLEQLARLREGILDERETLGTAQASLQREQSVLEELLARKLAQQQKLTSAAETEAGRAERLSRQATDLTDLIARLEAGAASRLPAMRPEPRPDPEPEPDRAPDRTPDSTIVETNPSETRMAVLRPPAEHPAMPASRLFSQAKGLIRPPAAGTVIRGFGDPDGLGGRSQGMTIATRPEAQLTAPFDGRISYAGSFRRYGELLIIAVGEGYHVLLAGMTTIDGTVGQSILAGEPIGTMGLAPSRDDLAAQGNSAERNGMSGRGPALYIEIRKDGNPIDPGPWLLMSDKKARG